MKNKIPGLGDCVKDKITGYTGVAYKVTRHTNGCTQLTIAKKKGKKFAFDETEILDINRLNIVSGGTGLLPGINYDWPHSLADVNDEVEDIISGFKGTIITAALHLSGDKEVNVMPMTCDKDGSMPFALRINPAYLRITKKAPKSSTLVEAGKTMEAATAAPGFIVQKSCAALN